MATLGLGADQKARWLTGQRPGAGWSRSTRARSGTRRWFRRAKQRPATPWTCEDEASPVRRGWGEGAARSWASRSGRERAESTGAQRRSAAMQRMQARTRLPCSNRGRRRWGLAEGPAGAGSGRSARWRADPGGAAPNRGRWRRIRRRFSLLLLLSSVAWTCKAPGMHGCPWLGVSFCGR